MENEYTSFLYVYCERFYGIVIQPITMMFGSGLVKYT